jgi:hypothetical protein
MTEVESHKDDKATTVLEEDTTHQKSRPLPGCPESSSLTDFSSDHDEIFQLDE